MNIRQGVESGFLMAIRQKWDTTALSGLTCELVEKTDEVAAKEWGTESHITYIDG